MDGFLALAQMYDILLIPSNFNPTTVWVSCPIVAAQMGVDGASVPEMDSFVATLVRCAMTASLILMPL
jgi:hypothetical protein